MNVKIATQLREATAWASAHGIQIIRGAWGEWREGCVVACDPVLALLLQTGVVTSQPKDLSQPGFVRLACEILHVDGPWLYRFWMGYDRAFQVMIITKDTESLDDISAFGIQLWREVSAQKTSN